MRYHLQIAGRMALLTIVFCAGLSVASAQEITGSIVGTVKDSTGAAVNGATVTITQSDQRVVVRTTTTSDGQFSIPNLTSAYYDVTVEAPNFKKHVESRVKLDVGQRRTVEVSLEAGNIAEVVTIEAAPVTDERKES